MLPFHILTRLRGEQNAQFAIIRIGQPELEAIRDISEAIKGITDKHGSYAAMHHMGDYQINFFTDFPVSFGFGIDLDEDPYTAAEEPEVLQGYDEIADAFAEACESGGHSLRTESTGLVIAPHGGSIRIRGYEKGDDDLLTSDDIAEAIRAHLSQLAPHEIIMRGTMTEFINHFCNCA